MNPPQWLAWARELQAIAQTGLTYASDHYDIGRYNSVRRVAAQMLAEGTEFVDSSAVLEMISADSGYATPKMDVRAAVFRQDRILLVQEREDHCWTLPGGWADIGDAPSEAAVREVREEAGYEVVPVKIAAVYDRDRHGHPPIVWHAWKLFFLCEIIGGQPASGDETEAVEFFTEDQLPPLSATRITREEIARMFDHRRHPEWPASFD